ncbi:hypothetical protein [Mycobacterium sp. E787]|uniref:hypothetical protein n=1 Tax=Mycobacterium sp. E787 TaxID=1834150 RepID=UPI0007FCC768|nr:hypothetical protein [Mycobacterium sp. E787]OBI53597.1 hypothetical protein A5705_02990 [Mycobacterium sp. E787]
MTEPATPAQHRLMFALWRQAGVTDRAARMALTSAIVGRDITTSAALTKADASAVIDALVAGAEAPT